MNITIWDRMRELKLLWKRRKKIVKRLKCPFCGSKEFLRGSRGGLAMNVKCMKCHHKLNIVHLPNGKIWIAEVIE